MFVLVNLKAYPCDPVTVAEAARIVADDTGVRIAVAPQAAGLGAVADTGVETWAQDVSPVDRGSHTGSTLAETAAAAGALSIWIVLHETDAVADGIETAADTLDVVRRTPI